MKEIIISKYSVLSHKNVTILWFEKTCIIAQHSITFETISAIQ